MDRSAGGPRILPAMSGDIPLPQFDDAFGSGSGSAALPPMPESPDREAFLALPIPGTIERYRAGIGVFTKDLLQLADEDLDTCFRPEAGVGRWSIRMVVGHVADAELVNAFRFRKAVAEEGAVLANWDFEAFLDAGLYDGPATAGDSSGKPAARSGQPLPAYLALIHAVRTTTAEWLGRLPGEAWSRVALHAERGPLTLHALVAGCAWHLEHHAWFVEAKARQLVGRSVLAALEDGR